MVIRSSPPYNLPPLTPNQKMTLLEIRQDDVLIFNPGFPITSIEIMDAILQVRPERMDQFLADLTRYASGSESFVWQLPAGVEVKEEWEYEYELSTRRSKGINWGGECPRCRETTVKCLEKQTRAADESVTIVLFCVNCRHVWRDQ